MVYISPDDPNTVYFSEQEYQEIQLRKKHDEALAQAEREARAKAEADIQAQRTKAMTEFEAGLESQVPTEKSIEDKIAERENEIRADFQKKIAEARIGSVEDREAKIKAAREDFKLKMDVAREQFKKQKGQVQEQFQRQRVETEAGFQKQLRSILPTIKREYAMSKGTQFTPRQIWGYKREQTASLQSMLQTEGEKLAKELSTQSDVFEKSITGEKLGYESELSEWEKSAKELEASEVKKEEEAFEEKVTEWRAEAKKDLGSQFAPWKEEELKKFKEGLSTWETEASTQTDKEIKDWLKEETKTFEKQVGEWRDAWQEKSYSQKILETKPYFPEQFKGIELGIREIVKVGAGVIGSGESLVYGVGGLLGMKTPSMPATLTGGIITSGIESIMSGQLKMSPELQKVSELGAGYAFGSVLGDVAISLGIGTAYQKFAPAPVKGIVTKITRPIEKGIGKAESYVLKPLKSAWSGSSAEKWLFSKSDWYAKQVAKSIAPSTAFLPQLDMPYDLTVKGGLPYSTKIAAEQMAWDEMMWGYERGIKMGRTALVGLGSRSAEALGSEFTSEFVVRSLPHLVTRGGQVSIGYLRSGKPETTSFESFSKALSSLPSGNRGMMSVSSLVKPILEPRSVVEPLVKIPVDIMRKSTMPSLSSQIFGAGAMASVQALAGRSRLRTVEPVKPVERLKPYSLSIPSTNVFQLPKSQSRFEVIPLLKSAQALKSGQLTTQVQSLIQRQLSPVIPKMVNVSKQAQVFVKPRLEMANVLGLPKPKKSRKLTKGKREYEYPIRSVSSVAKLVFGKTSKKKR